MILFRVSPYYSHIKERKKYGLKGARRALQFSKR
ncbi:30S ribosomal protein S9 [Peribacillus frigoritolerans]